MKHLKTFEGYGRQGDEAYPYPIYHNALLEYLPSSFLFDESDGQFDENFQRFACDIHDFLNLSDEDIEKTFAGFAGNTFNGEGDFDFLRKVETQAGDRFDKILVGGIPTPYMGGRTPDRLDIHGDTLYVFGEKTESNTKFLKDLVEESGYGEFNYYPSGYYRIWWD
jgi:hypothetical protein